MCLLQLPTQRFFVEILVEIKANKKLGEITHIFVNFHP